MTRLPAGERLRLGAAAEDLAAAYLRLRGYEVLDRNVRVGGGEIDLIARRGAWLLFFEVRYRGDLIHGRPIETIQGRKSRALARAARAYVSRGLGGATCWRFDVIGVVQRPDGEIRLRHFRAAVPL